MNTIILSLGGSLIVPDEINTTYLQQFRQLIIEEIEAGKQFVIFTGGGRTARFYIDGASAITTMTNDQLDWLGIHSSRLNAQLVKTILEEYAEPKIIVDPSIKRELNRPLTFGGGWKPGWSTDFCAMQFALTHGIQRVVNLSNIKYAYDKDPKQFPDAQPIIETTWSKFRTIVGEEWKPGLNMPFDPIASRLADENNKEVVIADGTNLANVRAIINGEPFEGTFIHN